MPTTHIAMSNVLGDEEKFKAWIEEYGQVIHMLQKLHNEAIELAPNHLKDLVRLQTGMFLMVPMDHSETEYLQTSSGLLVPVETYSPTYQEEFIRTNPT